MSIYLAIDIGGTNMKYGLVSEDHKLLTYDSIKTQDRQETADQITEKIIKACLKLLQEQAINKSEIKAIGIGVPGTSVNRTGLYIFTGNLPFRNYPLRAKFQEHFSCPIYIGNDANLAALAESRLGAGNGAIHSVVLTLGTGLGAGVVINNRVYSGFNETGCEFGHTVIVVDGEPCTCGRKGCLEAYVSAPGLIRDTKRAIAAHPDSILAKQAAESDNVSGRTAFDAKRKGCRVARQVVDHYTSYLGHGIANAINSYMPEVVIIGGGISHEGQELIDECKAKALPQAFVHGDVRPPRIVLASLGNSAGTLGAALFAEDCLEDGLNF